MRNRRRLSPLFNLLMFLAFFVILSSIFFLYTYSTFNRLNSPVWGPRPRKVKAGPSIYTGKLVQDDEKFSSKDNQEKNTGRKLFGDLGTPSYKVLFGSEHGTNEDDKVTCKLGIGILANELQISELPSLLTDILGNSSIAGNVSVVVHLSNEASKDGKVVNYLLRRQGIVTVLEHQEGPSKADSERLDYAHLLQTLDLNNCSYHFVFKSSLRPAKDLLQKVVKFLALFEDRTDWGYLTFVSGSRKTSFVSDLSTLETLEDNSGSLAAVLYRSSVMSLISRLLQSNNKGEYVEQLVMSQILGKMHMKVFERTPNLFQHIIKEPSTADMAQRRKEKDVRENWFSESFEYDEDNFTSHALMNSNADGYLGCYNDQVGHLRRDLGGRAEYRTYKGSVKLCREFCRGYVYFGLQDGLECYCGNEFGRYGNASDNECNKTCSKDKSAICGGPLKNSIYRVEPFPAKYVGCYHSNFLKEQTSNTTPSRAESINDCAAQCRSQPFFGITGGSSCYCLSSSITSESLSESHFYCNIRCHGNPTQLCGGKSFIAIFKNSLFSIVN